MEMEGSIHTVPATALSVGGCFIEAPVGTGLRQFHFHFLSSILSPIVLIQQNNTSTVRSPAVLEAAGSLLPR